MTSVLIENITDEFHRIRRFTEALVAPLETEDFIVQADTFVSPAKWHLAHTTWFFETFVLKEYSKDYQVYHPDFHYLFNSYYESVGTFHPQRARGLITRPTVSETFSYRSFVDEHISALLAKDNHPQMERIRQLIEIGLNHEQQHQELLLTDIKYNFSFNPTYPIYKPKQTMKQCRFAQPLSLVEQDGGLINVGHSGDGFHFDNEGPLHKKWIEPYRLANRPVTNEEFIEFIEDGGYQTSGLWLSDGWNTVKRDAWQAPLYWTKKDDAWFTFTLSGLTPVDKHAPVSHVSFYEADAYARWAGKRLPAEEEWEHALKDMPIEGNFAETGHYQPIAENIGETTLYTKSYGDVWEWTQSSYSPYPRNKPLTGALGEYNAKFMANQMVLKGGSCATPQSHIRPTYRNFFYPQMRWQFSGIRLAEDI